MQRVFVIFLAIGAAFLVPACSPQPGSGSDQPVASGGGSPSLAALLPAGGEVVGWKVSREPRTFTPDNLWELINGAADSYVTYGVQEVVTADYRQEGTGHEAVVEIYRMKDPLNAYGKYAEERSPDYRFLDVGNEGYSGGTTLNFWSGPCYVKITAFEESGALEQEMEKFARSVAAKVTEPGAEPVQFSFFPTENQVPRSKLYIPKDVLAQSFFTNGFEVRYEAGGKEYKLVLIEMESEASASDALDRYRQSLAGSGGDGVRQLAAPGEGGFAAKDGFYGNVAAVRAGRHVVVSLGASSEDAGVEQLAEIVANIR